MIVEFDKSFLKSLNKINDPLILSKIEYIINEFDGAKALISIRNIKKLSGFKNYYRIKTGDYRIGVELVDSETVRFIIIAHRKDIYRTFPKK
ncbi:MAG: type II toxin-antitoxin system RelE/ParE family toxin [Ignavibacteriaceae bacterium]|nr:type II toxin-antitoxin system RelE/ParE family toxin [Ignavibacteriaceae bacterium]